MSKERTQQEIDAEIKALEASKGWAPHYTMFGDDNWRGIDRQIEFLNGDIDTGSTEFEELSDDEQSAVFEAEDWMTGEESEAPSKGWDTFKEKKK